MLVFLALVAVPMYVYGWKKESAKWLAAEAMNLYIAGDAQTAIETLREAVEQSNESPKLLLDLATLLEQEGQANEGVLLAKLALAKLLANDPSVDTTMVKLALDVQSNCEKSLGRHADALATIKQKSAYLDQSESQSNSRRNNLAYLRALAGKEIGLAVRDAELVLAGFSASNYWGLDQPLSIQSEAVIAIAQVAHRLGQSRRAGAVLDQSIDELEQSSYELEQAMLQKFDQELNLQLEPSRRWEKKVIDPIRELISRKRYERAVLLTVRALIAQEQGEFEQCDLDRVRVQQLEFNSDEIAASLPPQRYYLQTLRAASAYLDTYGFVKYRAGEPEVALANLNLAILASKLNLLAIDSPLQNSSDEQADFEPELARRAFGRSYAANLYHRMLVREDIHQPGTEIGLSEQPWNQADADEIRNLGLDPTQPYY